MAMLDKKTAMDAYGGGRCIKLFAYGPELAKEGFLPGEWLNKHLTAANNANNTFLVWDGKSVGLYEIIK